jgi:hypothetical protein
MGPGRCLGGLRRRGVDGATERFPGSPPAPAGPARPLFEVGFEFALEIIQDLVSQGVELCGTPVLFSHASAELGNSLLPQPP